ncbi:unnamed protein product, partial [Dovyalis caffra]
GLSRDSMDDNILTQQKDRLEKEVCLIVEGKTYIVNVKECKIPNYVDFSRTCYSIATGLGQKVEDEDVAAEVDLKKDDMDHVALIIDTYATRMSEAVGQLATTTINGDH